MATTKKRVYPTGVAMSHQDRTLWDTINALRERIDQLETALAAAESTNDDLTASLQNVKGRLDDAISAGSKAFSAGFHGGWRADEDKGAIEI